MDLCKRGRIPGAVLADGKWQIPDDAEKPIDGRLKTGVYLKRSVTDDKRPLPVGISEYVRAQTTYYYVDKTLLIKKLLDDQPLVSLFTRPRRFGKTLNMDMLRVFFEKTGEDTGIYFKDKAIWKCGTKYTDHQGKYPVIFLTFKDVKYSSWEKTFNKVGSLLQDEFARHMELSTSQALENYEKEYFNRILSGQANEVELSSSLLHLSRMLAKHHGIAPVIIIDEYDTPIQEGYSRDFYEEIIGFMRNLFSGAFKDNSNLSYGILTGILRIAQESIFSGMNNLSVHSVLDSEYQDCFGFTEAEVLAMMEYYDISDKFEELKNWYDGYMFGEEEIYNPWSVINYIAKGCLPQAYWVNTGSTEILEDVLKSATDDITKRLYSLLLGEKVVARINLNVTYRSLTDEPENIYSLLLVAGYLKVLKKTLQPNGSWLCEVAIPNKEIAVVYKDEILSHLVQIGAVSRATSDRIAESLYSGDLERLQEAISDYLTATVSFYDTGSESFYHGLVLGLVALMDDQYKIRSNRESGDGRYDISLSPRYPDHPGIIMELKWGKGLNAEALERLASEALEQIESKQYDTEMRSEGITDICRFGIAFSGKDIRIITDH